MKLVEKLALAAGVVLLGWLVHHGGLRAGLAVFCSVLLAAIGLLLPVSSEASRR
jgi:hypothetical protein